MLNGNFVSCLSCFLDRPLGPNDVVAPQIKNRNPMNLEKMRIGHKPSGYDIERRKRSYWNRLDLVIKLNDWSVIKKLCRQRKQIKPATINLPSLESIRISSVPLNTKIKMINIYSSFNVLYIFFLLSEHQQSAHNSHGDSLDRPTRLFCFNSRVGHQKVPLQLHRRGSSHHRRKSNW